MSVASVSEIDCLLQAVGVLRATWKQERKIVRVPLLMNYCIIFVEGLGDTKYSILNIAITESNISLQILTEFHPHP